MCNFESEASYVGPTRHLEVKNQKSKIETRPSLTMTHTVFHEMKTAPDDHASFLPPRLRSSRVQRFDFRPAPIASGQTRSSTVVSRLNTAFSKLLPFQAKLMHISRSAGNEEKTWPRFGAKYRPIIHRISQAIFRSLTVT